jgi:hypothetical protein
MIVDLLKMSDETDLDILNNSMEIMVDQFQTELLPVAAMLTARLVRVPFVLLLLYVSFSDSCSVKLIV